MITFEWKYFSYLIGVNHFIFSFSYNEHLLIPFVKSNISMQKYLMSKIE
jgi:hypothetical protein